MNASLSFLVSLSWVSCFTDLVSGACCPYESVLDKDHKQLPMCGDGTELHGWFCGVGKCMGATAKADAEAPV